MKIIVDPDLCEAHGLCEMSAPDIFELGDEDTVTVLDENPPPAQWDAVRRAEGSCPRIAIRIEDDGPPITQ